ncbi:MAG TPA: M20/M25/M40 family metallo-hydrolase, partial [Bacteroidales bacterium]|nr:M20/M25/M40 family metallo-hydrolase [Bacteroidales bacterium]
EDAEGVTATFEEITSLSLDCKLPDCTHTDEAGCAVTEAVSKGDISSETLRNYKKMIREQQRFLVTVAEKRKKDREFGKMVKSIMQQKKRISSDCKSYNQKNNTSLMKKQCLFSIALIALSITARSQKEGLVSINKSDLKAYMTFFASDELEGRETGTNGNNVAALYIKTNLMRLGLTPYSETGDYFQMIPMVSKYIDPAENSVSINSAEGAPVFSSDSVVFFSEPSNTVDFTGNVVFAGYGYEDMETGYNDLEGIGLKNKIVLFMTGNPQLTKGGENDIMFNPEIEGQKLNSIFSKGAKAVMIVYNPESKFSDVYSSGLADMAPGRAGMKMVSAKRSEEGPEEVPIVAVTQHTADILLKPTGYNLKQMEDKILTGNKPVSVEIEGITASFRSSVITSDFFSPNVIGIIEGSDPVLKNECIIYTAHFDHAGVNDRGEVFNGADDDASGSMALLEIAEAFMNLKKQPLRTVVFAWVNGEEKGLLGSRYYAANPYFPMEKTLVDINLDMIGRSKMPSDTTKFMGFDLTVTQPGEVLSYSAHESSELLEMLTISANQSGVKVIDMGRNLQFGTSDHASFMAKGVPAFLFISGMHSDLHSTRDDVERIDFYKMESVSKMVFLLGYKVANQRKRIKLDIQQ